MTNALPKPMAGIFWWVRITHERAGSVVVSSLHASRDCGAFKRFYSPGRECLLDLNTLPKPLADAIGICHLCGGDAGRAIEYARHVEALRRNGLAGAEAMEESS